MDIPLFSTVNKDRKIKWQLKKANHQRIYSSSMMPMNTKQNGEAYQNLTNQTMVRFAKSSYHLMIKKVWISFRH